MTLMSQLFGRGHLEARHRAALWVERGHDLADRAVLAGRVDPLQDHEHGTLLLRPEPFLELGEAVEQPVDGVLAALLVEPVGGTGVDLRQVEAVTRCNAHC